LPTSDDEGPDRLPALLDETLGQDDLVADAFAYASAFQCLVVRDAAAGNGDATAPL
jgi:hypothetical protein